MLNKIIISIVLFVGVVSCNSRYQPVSDIVRQADLKIVILESTSFNHVLFINKFSSKSILHIYLGSDGSPWNQGVTIATDPTPTNPLALTLLALDEQPGLYVGRPCYFGQFSDRSCTKELWTSGRYSATVVASMVEVITKFLADKSEIDLVLFGYSGGAVLATLMANQLPNVIGLVTIAGNLDIDLWTQLRGFIQLTGSLNPRDIAAIKSDILQIHLIGNKDQIVPNVVTKSFYRVHGGLLWQYPTFDHSCCWKNQWPSIIEQLDLLFNKHQQELNRSRF